MPNQLERRSFKLKDGTEQEVYINPKVPVAVTKTNGQIHVSPEFFTLNDDEQNVVMHHEIGHLKSNKLLFLMSRLSIILFGANATYALVRLIFDIMNLRLVVYLNMTAVLILIPTFLILSAVFTWLLEINCDANAVKNMGKYLTARTIEKIYTTRRFRWFWQKWEFHLWSNLILHPPLRLRIKIIEKYLYSGILKY